MLACDFRRKLLGGEKAAAGGAATAYGDRRQSGQAHAVPDYDEYVGRFTAVDLVEICARESGYLDLVDFKDGQMVKQGDLLFTIDKRPFQNALDQARANLEAGQIERDLYQGRPLSRGQQLVRDKTITDQTFEQRAQANRNAQAAVSANEAAVKQAELDLEYSELHAPVSGRIGDRRVSPGNLVTGGTTGNTTLLATIVSIDPIRFEFTFDESSFCVTSVSPSRGTMLPAAASAYRSRSSSSTSTTTTTKAAWISSTTSSTARPARSAAAHSSPMLSMACSRPACLRVFACRPRRLMKDCWCLTWLWVPNRRASLSASSAPTTSWRKNTSHRPSHVGRLLRVIKDGLGRNDRVVVNGLMRARAGQKVTPQEQGKPGAAPAPGASPPQKPK